MIERDFDVSFVADLALREKQIQQTYRPIIAVHKWFARRPGTLFRSLLLSEFASAPVREAFFKTNSLKGKRIADPFMGGGTPLLEANRLGCDVVGYDINPMSVWIVREEIKHIDLQEYRLAAESILAELETKIGHLYRTECLCCGSTTAHVKYFLWVKTQSCLKCQRNVDLFPGYLLAEDRRHPKNVIVCQNCGDLNESSDRENLGKCESCREPLALKGPAHRNSCQCPHCGETVKYPDASLGPPQHRLFAIEYYCSNCKRKRKGRFFKKPDKRDLMELSQADCLKDGITTEFIPTEAIPDGDETGRLHRWGYRHYSEMFNPRQLVGLELICRAIRSERSERVQDALATNLSDLLRYQNMLCRYDTMALKSLDIFSVHGFPVGLVQCESNILGILDSPSGVNVGSGGWSNILEKYVRAKAYCDRPFETRHCGGKKSKIYLSGEWIGENGYGTAAGESREVDLRCGDASSAQLSPNSVDAVLTDPPYFGNVQYAELIDFCYVWLRHLVRRDEVLFCEASTRNCGELTGNENMKRGLTHFTEGLSGVFQKMAEALKPGAPLVFTYHHNKVEAYYPIAVAILDSGLTCSASIPCPAEMGASIHINGTESSIIDTVFVCRKTGKTRRDLITTSIEGTAGLVQEDLKNLSEGGVKPTLGDMRCIARGHLIRLAIWDLRKGWNNHSPTHTKLAAIDEHVNQLGGPSAIEKLLSGVPEHGKSLPLNLSVPVGDFN
jgi:putative DNA methylase